MLISRDSPLIGRTVCNLTRLSVNLKDVEKRQKKRLLLDYLSENLKHHNWWAYRYFFCEFLALINVIGMRSPLCLSNCVADPEEFLTDPDPRIWIRFHFDGDADPDPRIWIFESGSFLAHNG